MDGGSKSIDAQPAAAGAGQTRPIAGRGRLHRRSSGVALDGLGTRTKDQFGLVLIVAPAARRDVLGGCRTSERVGSDVMQLQEGALGASASILADEGALASIVPPCRSFDVARRVTRGEPATRDRVIRPGADSARRSRFRRRAQLLLFDPLEKEGDRAVEDRARIATRMLPSLCWPALGCRRGDRDPRDQRRERGGSYSSWSVCITVVFGGTVKAAQTRGASNDQVVPRAGRSARESCERRKAPPRIDLGK